MHVVSSWVALGLVICAMSTHAKDGPGASSEEATFQRRANVEEPVERVPWVEWVRGRGMPALHSTPMIAQPVVGSAGFEVSDVAGRRGPPILDVPRVAPLAIKPVRSALPHSGLDVVLILGRSGNPPAVQAERIGSLDLHGGGMRTTRYER